MNKTFELLKIGLLSIIAVCLMIIAYQEFNSDTQDVYVQGGDLNAKVRGYVSVDGSVSVDNTVDINIQAINGHRNVFFNNPRRGDNNSYYRIPVVAD